MSTLCCPRLNSHGMTSSTKYPLNLEIGPNVSSDTSSSVFKRSLRARLSPRSSTLDTGDEPSTPRSIKRRCSFVAFSNSENRRVKKSVVARRLIYLDHPSFASTPCQARAPLPTNDGSRLDTDYSSEDLPKLDQDKSSVSKSLGVSSPIKISHRVSSDEDEAMMLESPLTPQRNGMDDDGFDSCFFSEPSPSICTKASISKIGLCVRTRPSLADEMELDSGKSASARDSGSNAKDFDVAANPIVSTKHDDSPWRMDIKKLELMTRVPNFASRIQSLTVSLTLTNLLMFEEEPATADMKDLGATLHIEAILKDKKHSASLTCLRRVLRRLRNFMMLHLACTDVSWGEPAFDTPLPEFQQNKIISTQQCVIDSLDNLKARLQTLVFEPFMFSELSLPSSLEPCTMTTFNLITMLGLNLIYTEKPLKQETLEYFLSLLPNLTRLKLWTTPGDWAPRDVEFLPETFIMHLESLDLRCLHFRLDSFGNFLRRHCKTIKHLSLVSLDGLSPPENPCPVFWDLIFLLIGAKFEQLNTAFINGVFRQEGLGSQIFYQDSETILFNDYRGQGAMGGETMERFLVEGGEYPQPEWRSRGD